MADNDSRGEAHPSDHPGDGVSRGTARLEAFADAVFAIALTLPVVELELPHKGPLLDELARLWPSYLGYGISAAVIGTYWSRHHFTGALSRTTGHWLNLATLLFLMAVGFIAYPSRLLAENIADPVERIEATWVFVGALAVTSAIWLVKWETVLRTGHIDERLEPAYVARITRVYRWTVLAYAVAFLLALLWWPAGLIGATAITLRYLTPPTTPVYRAPEPEIGEES